MVTDHLRRYTRWLVEPIARALHRLGVTPNGLTVLGFLLSIVNAWLLATGRLRLAGALILLFSALDAFDGALARMSGQVTRFGAFLDSVLDRYAEGVLFFGLLICFAQAGRREELYLTYVAIIGSQLVSYTRARAEGLGLRCQEGWFTRVERILVLAAGLLLNWLRPVLWLLAILTNVTALQRMALVYRLTREDPRGGVSTTENSGIANRRETPSSRAPDA
ncbi:MAG: CDP-alcohol phosphatidyltransferase family protein [Anaerolineae bacterium]|nr:CDP-alcohol phosphatidyltransferase family protein [Anaerolineae bacterium]